MVGEFVTLENTQNHRRHGFDGVLHLLHQGSLQPDEIAGQHVVEDLPTAVFQGFVAKRPTGQNREKVRAVGTFNQKCRPGVGNKLARLEARQELQFVLVVRLEMREILQGAFFAGELPYC